MRPRMWHSAPRRTLCRLNLAFQLSASERRCVARVEPAHAGRTFPAEEEKIGLAIECDL